MLFEHLTYNGNRRVDWVRDHENERLRAVFGTCLSQIADDASIDLRTNGPKL